MRVRASVREQPGLSTEKRSSILNMPRRTLNRVLHKDLYLHPHKIEMVQELNSQDRAQRLQFANEMLERFTNFNIFFSDEAHFHLNEHLNRQNCRYWSGTNPTLKHQKPLHSPKVTAWAAICYICQNTTHGLLPENPLYTNQIPKSRTID